MTNKSLRHTRLRQLVAAATTISLMGWTGSTTRADDRPARSASQEAETGGEQAGLGLTYISSPRGVMVAEVLEEGPADKAGIREGDRVVSIAGEPVITAQSALNRVGRLAPGTQVLVEITRGQENLEVAVTLDRVPDAIRKRDDDPSQQSEDGDQPMTFRADASVEREVNLGWELATTDEGVRVERLEAGGSAGKAHLEEGDVIVNIAGENVLTHEAIYRTLNQLDGGSQVEVTVKREGEEITYLLELPADHQRDVTRDPAEPRGQVRQETTRRRTDTEQSFRESDYEELNERRLLIEILRELAYQRQLLQAAMSGGSATPVYGGAAVVPGQPTPRQQPDDSVNPGDERPERDRTLRQQEPVPVPNPPPVIRQPQGRQPSTGRATP